MLAGLNILVMSCHWQGALACLQSFGQKGHRVFLVVPDAHYAKPHTASDYAVEAFEHVPSERPEADVPWLLGVIEEHEIDLVVPISDHDAMVVALAAEAALPGMRAAGALFAPSVEALRIASDRNETAALCARLGIAAPRSQAVAVTDLRAVVPGWGYPVFIKQTGQASQGVHELQGPGDLEAFLEGRAEGIVQIQEAICGDFVDVTGICKNGAVLESFGFRVDYEFSKGGTPPFAFREERADLREILEQIAGALEWSGGIDIDLLEREDGTLAVLEINPRFSGTVNFALKTGKDIPAGYLVLKGVSPGAPPYQDGGADMFVSLEEEARYLAKADRAGRKKARALRAAHVVAENAYPQDRGYSRAMRRKLASIRLDRVIDAVLEGARRAGAALSAGREKGRRRALHQE